MDFQESSFENIVVGITFQEEKRATLGEYGLEVIENVFLRSCRLIFSWKSTYTSEDLQLDATGINRKELSPVSRNFDMNWIK